MTVEFGCPKCGKPIEAEPGDTVACRHCGEDATLHGNGDTVERCLACECDELYRHRDFNQKVGIAVLGIGVLLWFLFKSFIPMIVAAVIDLVLYKAIPDVGICYRCKAHHRDFDNIKSLPSFDLERHEHYRFQKARDEGRIPPREPAKPIKEE